MLLNIHIRDFVTIEELHIDFKPGCIMITGETGAGKSIFIEAIECALGGRSSPAMIRTQKDKAEISICFDITHFSKVIALLKNVDFYIEDNLCFIRRVISNDGRSRSYVNNIPSPLQFTKELGELLFHLHGQYEQQVLLKPETQREMVDRYGDHLELAMQVKHAAETWKSLQLKIKELQEQKSTAQHRMQYIHYQLDELTALQLQENEWEQLELSHRKLLHSEEILRTVQHVTHKLSHDEEHTISSLLNDIKKMLENIHHVETKAHEWITIINSIFIQLNELDAELHNYIEQTELDEQQLQQLEIRISSIYTLARKFKLSPAELVNYQKKLSDELHALNHDEHELLSLQQEQQLIVKKYQELAQQLTKARIAAAKKLAKEITLTIRSLALPHAELTIALEPLDAHQELSMHGNEKIIFLIKTNPDQPPQPLAKVISGGELSRLSLAAHLALAHRTHIPTLIFDEVDSGLSGAAAEKIGKLLRTLGESYQVFCITHQAQVAANSHHHLLVEKYVIEKSTFTKMRLLTLADKIQEIARMLGGEKVTAKTIAHAKEMVMPATS